MNRLFLFFLSTIMACSALASVNLDSIYSTWLNMPDVKTTEVRYRGGFKQGCPGFTLQRRGGEGWTSGVRIQRSNINRSEAAMLKSMLKSTEGIVVNPKTWHVVTLDARDNRIYAFFYNPRSNEGTYLRADIEIEDKACVPQDWYIRDIYDGLDPTPAETLIDNNSTPSVRDWGASVARLYDEVRYNFAFYDQISDYWEDVYNETLHSVKSASDQEAYRALQRMVAQCGDGHTYISNAYLYGIGSSPFQTKMLSDGLFITSVESQALDSAGMKRGMKILAINGLDPTEYAEKNLKPYVCSSTPQWTTSLMYDDYNLSRGPNGTPLNLTLSDGRRTVEIIHSINGAQWEPQMATKTENFSFKVVKKGRKEKVGILTIRNFGSSEVTHFFDSIYPQISNTDALIIDLRGNGGGNSGYADHLLRHFSDSLIVGSSWSSPMHIAAYKSWNRDLPPYKGEANMMQPIDGHEHYLKPMAVLIDRQTFSAAEDFVSAFRSMKRGIIVGTPSGGSTGNGVRVMLTPDIMANICSKHDLPADGIEFVGIGIIPDIIVEESSSSYFNPNHDVVLEAAIKSL